jgi:acyl transferase domain-containing protein/acyl-CoA synthetase (AMP-forming)/AMP-acid ligase II/aryl carrier-like protein
MQTDEDVFTMKLPPRVTTLTDLLTYRYRNQSRGGYTFLRDGVTAIAQLDFVELGRKSRSIAARVAAVAEPGSRALLLFPSGISFLPAFFACLRAGVIAVPLPLPEASRLKHSVPRLLGVAQDAQPVVALTIDAALPDLRDRLGSILPRLNWIGTEFAESEGTDVRWGPPTVGEADIAYLQYTSGSTGRPRGVMISHANLLANLSQLRSAFVYDSDSVAVTWMPHYHDYGLVEGLLQPLFSDIPSYILSPLTFLKRPLRWLQAISRFGATHSHAPNFAYELCSAQTGIAEAGLSLGCWRMAGNGAEPIRAETLRRFARTFAGNGFSASAFFPAYGLAEATLFASARRPTREWVSRVLDADALEKNRVTPAPTKDAAKRTREIVSCGGSQGGRILIVDPDTRRPCGSDRVGEIWLADRSIGCGYWNDQNMSAEVFRARLAGKPDEGSFLRTGDLGFVSDGELYITGRLKDLVIVAGVNHYPQDIEWTALAAAPELRRDHCVAFASEQCGQEELIIIAEAADRTPGNWDAVFQRVRVAITQEHDIDPAAIIVVRRGKIPKTSSGKLQRAACKQAWQGGLPTIAAWQRSRESEAATSLTPVELEDWLRLELARELNLTPDEISVGRPIAEYGVNSRLAVALVGRLEQRIGGRELSPTLLWEHPTIAGICSHLLGAAKVTSQPTAVPTPVAQEPIAVIGLACRFPGAPTATEYWSLLRNGRNGLGTSPRLPGVVAGFLPEVTQFDARFFGISALEAQAMDPQQQLLLEVAWEALEDAGIAADQLRGQPGGVFVGISAMDFAYRSLWQREIGAHTAPGVALSIASNRLSYALDLTGPSMSIDTACSSSLVAVHQACRAIRGGECDFALAGGVNVLLSPIIHRALNDGGMLSPSSLCRTFDADADGYVRGEGCGVVVLKRISAATRDGDPVLAVIRGSAVNQDGRSNGLTAPNPAAQTAVIRAALADARLPASAIDYAEAHGTGTRLGDPIEIGALVDALGAERSREDPCFIGSVKTNIGHLEAAAGIAGLIKTILALRQREIPPHINLTRINPLIQLEQTPFEIPLERAPWPSRRSAEPRRACVSSFGFGGTNANVVLEEVSDAGAMVEDNGLLPLVISACSVPALRALALRHAERLDAAPAPAISSYCATLATGRAGFRERFAIVATDRAAHVAGLRDFAAEAPDAPGHSGRAPDQPPGIGFLFSGQGGQYAGMARRLYEAEPFFRRQLDACEAALGNRLEHSLLHVIFDDKSGLLDHTEYTQPALFAVEYALARLLMHWGIKPDSLLGHSFGEYVAACVAEVLDMPDAISLVTVRGQIMRKLAPAGAMLSVRASETELLTAIKDYADRVSIAAVNSPSACVLSGEPRALVTLQSLLELAGVRTRPLLVSQSFHSPLVDPALEAFYDAASRIKFGPQRIKLISNFDGAEMTVAPDAAYWTRHLRRTVRFADGVATLTRSCSIILEIGPDPILVSLAAECISDREITILPTLRRDTDDMLMVREILAHLHVCGVRPDWGSFFGDNRIGRMHGVPTYPFEHLHFPIPPIEPSALLQPDAKAFGDDFPVWLQPVWRATAEPVSTNGNGRWLLLGNGNGWGEAIGATLEAHGRQVEAWNANISIDKIACSLDQDNPPEGVVWLGGIDTPLPCSISPDDALAVVRSALSPALALAQRVRQPTQLWLLTQQAQAVASGDTMAGLFQTPIWGFGRSLALERPEVFGGLLDLADGQPRPADVQIVAALVCASRQDTQYAVRDGKVYSPRILRAAARSGEPPLIVPDASYLVTGGFGDIGRRAVRALIDAGAQHIWVLSRAGGADPRATAMTDEFNGQVDLRSAALDITDAAELVRRIDTWERIGPPLRGIIHAAGQVDRIGLEVLSWHDIEMLIRPKVQGTWALAHAIAGRRLDFFVCCSSIAALWGGRGQAAYAAANTFLDGFASYRAAFGLAAVSVALGPIRGTRMVPEEIVAELRQFGLHAMPLDPIGRTLLRVPAAAAANLSIVSVDIGRFSALYGARSPSGLFDELTRDPDPAFSQVKVPQRVGSPEVLGMEAILAWLTAQVASALHLPQQEVDPNRPLSELGLDSLTAMELRNRAKRRLNVSLPLHELLGNRGLAWLAEHVATSTPTAAAAEVPVWVEGEI